MEQVWNGHPAQHHFLGIAFDGLERRVWNGIRGFDPELWIGVWFRMCARPCSGPFILSGSHVSCVPSNRWVKHTMEWLPPRSCGRGRPRNSWDSQLEAFTRTMGWVRWMDHTVSSSSWANDFVAFFAFVQT